MDKPNTIDPAMLELFRAEMDAHVPVLSEGLIALEKGRAANKDFEAMMRAAHSIKGAARIVGIEAAVRVAHVLEDCFSAAQGEHISLGSEAVDVLLHGVDVLQRICSPQSEPPLAEQVIQSLLERIASIRDGRSFLPPKTEAREAPATPVTVEPATRSVTAQQFRATLPSVVDATAAESLRIELSSILRREPSRILLDFGQVRSLNAAALSLLASFAREMSRFEAAISVGAEGVTEEMAVLLRTTGLDRTIKRAE